MMDASAVQPFIRPDPAMAFELYRAMDPPSLRKLADKTGVPFSTLALWSTRDGWSDKLRQEQDQARRAIRQQADAWLVGTLPARLKQIEEELSRIEDVYKPSDDGMIHVVKATPASVRAKLLMFCIEKAIPTVASASGDDDAGEASVDVSQLSDSDLFAEVKRQAQR